MLKIKPNLIKNPNPLIPLHIMTEAWSFLMCRWKHTPKSTYNLSSTSLQTTICSLDSLILSDQTNIPTHFSSLNLALLYKQMEMYGQGRYTIALKKEKKKEIYSLISTVPPLYFLFLFQNFSLSLSLSLSHFECYIKISQIEDNIQSYQWATHWKDCLLI